MANHSDRPNVIPWPPILYAALLALAYGLHGLWPLVPFWGPLSVAIGWLLLGTGVAFGLAGIVRFRQLGTPIEPTSRATVLATDGVYRLTRNPMYVGAVMALLGLAVATRWVWLLVLTLFLPGLLWHLAIKREEAYLARSFGGAYEEYRRRVRRWL